MKRKPIAALLACCMLTAMVPSSFAASTAVALAGKTACAAMQADWKAAYRELVYEQVSKEAGSGSASTYVLRDLDGDDTPELLIVGPYEAQGDRLYTMREDGTTDHLAVSQGDFLYDAASGLIWTPYGHMDRYRDAVYRLADGAFVKLHEGRYGLWNTSDPYAGPEAYTYKWDGETVTGQQYTALLHASVDTEGAVELNRGAVSAQTVLAQLDEEQTPDTGFADVPSGAWYAEAVAYVLENGIMQGTSDRLFSPDDTTTRAMLVTILHRLEGGPQASAPDFSDVPANAYYADAVAWASARGIVTGTSAGRFSPEDPITREQLAAILYRYAAYKSYDTASGSASLSRFSDAFRVSSYAENALRWAIGKGLITGVSDTALDPQGTAARAQVAVILTRFIALTD